jgi:hypothetical protein
MNKLPFKYAKEIVIRKRVQYVGQGNDREFYVVAGVPIKVYQDRSGYHFDCTCLHCSTHSVNNPFCSYKASLITYLTLEDFKEKKEVKK